MALPESLSAWPRLALDLPTFHEPLSAGEAGAFLDRVAGLPPLAEADLAALAPRDAELLALDVFMVEAMARRHGLGAVAGALDAAAAVVAAWHGCEPILSYPFYIRLNPTDLARIRRFTPTEAEFRFIRMHRLIEDLFDGLIASLEGILDDPRPEAALAAAFEGIAETFRTVNRTVGGFRDPRRMPHEVFFDGFRPYYGTKPLPGGGVLEGPSGLQSPSFRQVGMLMGYRDAILDGWTERIGHYHGPATRSALARTRAARDAGRSLATLAERYLGPAPAWPHLHPAFAAELPDLVALAQREGYVTADVLEVLADHQVRLGSWPADAPAPAAAPPPAPVLPELGPEARATLGRMARLEAMLLGFHLEHVAITAVQIGYIQGTGGTSGVEFLLLATFRRAFPTLWASGWGARLGAG